MSRCTSRSSETSQSFALVCPECIAIHSHAARLILITSVNIAVVRAGQCLGAAPRKRRVRCRLPRARQHLAHPPGELRRDYARARPDHQHGRLLPLPGATQSKRGRHRLPRRLVVDAASDRFQVNTNSHWPFPVLPPQRTADSHIAKTSSNLNTLHRYNRPGLVMLILGLGARPNAKDCNGKGALDAGGVCQSNHAELWERTGETCMADLSAVRIIHILTLSLLLFNPSSVSAGGCRRRGRRGR
jgi:hypothetical protein